ncbi:T9SS type A sorting domain-containing protein [candidate division TA06 bacterium]|uniref:T9SS type A sorting domain-containing protein n=1 Tax=candidate division TA06 bacterium TaxID=2250710 RepID=A0A523UPC8_UNCT6|nr:MAG: T9SS type A sorting domain-containing protein [candidate division TA06 bacterium]
MKWFAFCGFVLLGVALLAQAVGGVQEAEPYGQLYGMKEEGNPERKPLSSLGDSIWAFYYAGEQGLYGVEFDGNYFFVTGDNAWGDSNMIYVFDRNGKYVREFAQKSNNSEPGGWGWHDLAYRPDHDYFFGSDDSMITAFDKFGKVLYEFRGPHDVGQGLAWDGQYLWVSLQNLAIVKTDTTGAVVASYPNSYMTQGLAWDDASSGNPWLWVSAWGQGWYNRIYQFDPVKGQYTGVYFEGGYWALAGGLAFSTDWDTSRAILFELCQEMPDYVVAYDLGPIATRAPRGNKTDVMAELEGLKPTGDKKLDKRIDKIIGHIEKSLEEKRWIDDTHLDPKHGKKVFCEEKKAVKYMKKLCKGDKCKGVASFSLIYHGINEVLVEAISKKRTCFGPELVSPGDTFEIDAADEKLGANTEIWVDDFLNQEIHTSCSRPLDEGMVFGDFEVKDVDKISYGGGAFPGELCERLIGMLVEADSILARVAIEDAKEAGGKEKEIEKAEKEMAKAEKDKDKAKYDKAIDHYKHAWQHAQKAMKKHKKQNQMMEETRSRSTTVLLQSRPNPCREFTIINYQLTEPAHTTLRIYDTSGSLVRTLVDGSMEAGNHVARWDGRDGNGSPVPSGVYFYMLKPGDYTAAKKLLLLR